MKIVIAPDSFKGSISSTRAVEKMTEGIREEWPEAQIIPFPLADGGEGTVDALLGILGGVKITVQVNDPLGREILATYGWIEEEKLAVIETAAASGLPLLSETERDPRNATSFGTGQLILHALGRGAKKIILGLGGSATVDAGMGILQALGIRFYDRNGQVLKGCGKALGRVERIDLSSFDPRAVEVPLILASDVQNPLLGPTGAVRVFGPQKGVSESELETFEKWMEHFADRVVAASGKDHRNTPGSGAAGGIGFGLLSFLSARIESGFELIARLGNLSDKIAEADLVMTGEGKFDAQSSYGKATVGVGKLASRYGVPVVVFAGAVEDHVMEQKALGIDLIWPIVDQVTDLKTAMREGEEMLKRAVLRVMKTLKWSREIGGFIRPNRSGFI